MGGLLEGAKSMTFDHLTGARSAGAPQDPRNPRIQESENAIPRGRDGKGDD